MKDDRSMGWVMGKEKSDGRHDGKSCHCAERLSGTISQHCDVQDVDVKYNPRNTTG